MVELAGRLWRRRHRCASGGAGGGRTLNESGFGQAVARQVKSGSTYRPPHSVPAPEVGPIFQQGNSRCNLVPQAAIPEPPNIHTALDDVRAFDSKVTAFGLASYCRFPSDCTRCPDGISLCARNIKLGMVGSTICLR